jgi:hypothetical protein
MLLFPLIAGLLPAVFALPHTQSFGEALSKRQSNNSNALEVDLGYEVYQGSTNTTTGINTWRG